jgi:hypothetical protein
MGHDRGAGAEIRGAALRASGVAARRFTGEGDMRWAAHGFAWASALSRQRGPRPCPDDAFAPCLVPRPRALAGREIFSIGGHPGAVAGAAGAQSQAKGKGACQTAAATFVSHMHGWAVTPHLHPRAGHWRHGLPLRPRPVHEGGATVRGSLPALARTCAQVTELCWLWPGCVWCCRYVCS